MREGPRKTFPKSSIKILQQDKAVAVAAFADLGVIAWPFAEPRSGAWGEVTWPRGLRSQR